MRSIDRNTSDRFAKKHLLPGILPFVFLIAAFFIAGCAGGGGTGIIVGTSTGGSTSTTTLTVTSISPVSGPTTGGTAVTVTGTNFPTGITVTFGGTPATSVVVNSGTSATVTTPVHVAGTVDVVVSVSGGSSATLAGGFQFNAPGTALSITTATPLLDVVQNTSFNQTIATSGGSGTQLFTITTGSLPAGLSLNSTTGLISGTPTAAGLATFTLQVSDSTGATSKTFTLNVIPTLKITGAAALTDAMVGGTYSQQIANTGGSGTQVWAVSAGSIPAGLTLQSSTGVISGSPTTAGPATFTVTVTDALQTANQAVTLNVVTPARLTGAIQGTAFTFTPAAISTGGAPLSWSITAGALPAGLVVSSSDGTISGTPTAFGTFNFTLSVTNTTSTSSETPFLIVSAAAPVVGNVGDPYVGETPANLDPAAVPIAACGATLSTSTSYRLTASMGTDPTATCLTIPGANVKIDLAGFTITGRIVMNANASGVIVFDGAVNCNNNDGSGSNTGCVTIVSQAPPTAQARLHHLTVHNSGGSGTIPFGFGSRAIHVGWDATAPASTPGINLRIFNNTALVNNQPSVIRSSNLNVTGPNLVVEISNNDFTCDPDAAACQGAVCDQTLDCRVHGNKMTMNQNTTTGGTDTARAMTFDTVPTAEIWNNTVLTNNNRAVRVRDSTNVYVHNNAFNNITKSGALTTYVAAVHLADPDFGTDDLNIVIEKNSFQIVDGTGIFIRNGIHADIRNNAISCLAPCSGLFAVARTPQVIACPAGTSRPGLICDGTTYQTDISFESMPTVALSGLPSPQIQVAPLASVTVCKSGTAGAGPGGLGTIVTSTTCP